MREAERKAGDRPAWEELRVAFLSLLEGLVVSHFEGPMRAGSPGRDRGQMLGLPDVPMRVKDAVGNKRLNALGPEPAVNVSQFEVRVPH
jgi:hypothetical protein